MGGAGRDELESKFGCWVDNLSKCVECEPAEADADADAHGPNGDASTGASVEHHRVQERWFLNKFIFSTRQWLPLPPRSAACSIAVGADVGGEAPSGSKRTPNMSNGSGVSEARRRQLLEEWHDARRRVKRERRRQNLSDEQRALYDEKERARLASGTLRVTLEPLGRVQLRLRLWLEVHESVRVRFGGTN